MAYITLNTHKLKANFHYLDKLFKSHRIEWSVVVKVFCGNRKFLEAIFRELNLKQVCDSRITNLKIIKSIAPEIETIFIKPPPKRMVSRIIEFADISFNTELETIKLLSKEAVLRNKTHKVVIMIEMGELREGVMREQFIDFYEAVFDLPNIAIVGIGTNLTCMSGVLPNQDKLIQLCLYKQLIEARFNKVIPYISGGASVTIPLIEQGLLPLGVNHFRVGETLFLGTDVYNNNPHPELHQDIFKLYAEIIELSEKPLVPNGELGKNLLMQELSIDETLLGTSSFRAIVDIGLLDIDETTIKPVSEDMTIVGVSSDMFVLDLGTNPKDLKVGNLIEFSMNYMGILRIMNSDYVDKRFELNDSKPHLAASK